MKIPLKISLVLRKTVRLIPPTLLLRKTLIKILASVLTGFAVYTHHSLFTVEKIYAVPFGGGWDLKKHAVCRADKFAQLSFPLRNDELFIESERPLVCLSASLPVVAHSHALVKDATYQMTMSNGIINTIFIADIDPVTRLISFRCTAKFPSS